MRGEPAPRRPYTIEDLKRDLTPDPEKLGEACRNAFKLTEDEREHYREELHRMMTGGWTKQKRM